MDSPRSPERSKGAAIRESVTRRENRLPRHMTHEEIAAMPRLRFVKGMESGIFISRDRDESRFYSQGLCFHDADMDDLTWDEVSWDEAFYCMKGKLKVVVTDAEGNQAEYDMNEGDHFWAPAGYKYTLKATGVESINFWTMAPVLFTGWRDTGDAQGPIY
ncbi:MAG TPA: hypothetical protein VMB26_16920, partial [Candidatus Binataceae bacterium]|nr:hypothetical protein [Candidatus Binataceae bacterium]